MHITEATHQTKEVEAHTTYERAYNTSDDSITLANSVQV